jgi:hypothetical protein
MNDITVLLNLRFANPEPQGRVRVTAELTLPGSSSPEGESGFVVLSFEELNQLKNRPEAYRQRLTEEVFRDRRLERALTRARMAQRDGFTLHIRFEIPKDAVPLHGIVWELLGDPESDGAPPLGRGERVFFSRYLLPATPRPGNSETRRLKSVVVIANPRFDQGGHPLLFPAIDVAAELELARRYLGLKTDPEVLVGAKANSQGLGEALSKGCDILYLACHGSLIEDQSLLYLEQAGSKLDIVTADVLTQRIRNLLALPPRLVVMAACQSSGGGVLSDRADYGFLSSFAAWLVDAGVPAVVGMQGSVTETTSLEFMTKLMASVLSNGQIAVAMSLARSVVQRRDDWWMPVLLTSTKEALWKTRPEFQDWRSLNVSFSLGQALPILGPDIIPGFSNFDFSKHLRNRMTGSMLMGRNPEPSRVAQEYKILNGLTGGTRGTIEDEFRRFVQETLSVDLGVVPRTNETLDQHVRRWSERDVDGKANLIMSHLAALPAPVFLTTNADSLLQQALERARKRPETEVLPWRGEIEKVQALKDRRVGDELPTEERPLVHHLFGHFEQPGSLVVAEDDFFDYLIWLVANRQSIWIRTLLCDSSLIFLGFRLQDWEFRLLLRSIAKLQGAENLSRMKHVAVQVEDTGEPGQRDQVMNQMESFFKNSDVKLSIYWGTAEQFLTELHANLTLSPAPVGVAR